MSTAELAASYAALILADEGLEITVRACSHEIPAWNICACRSENEMKVTKRKRINS
jgi:hypothetical protein